MMMAEQEKPNYEQSGRLVDDVPGEYMYPGDLKHYSTPPDAATPLVVWALYPVRVTLIEFFFDTFFLSHHLSSFGEFVHIIHF